MAATLMLLPAPIEPALMAVAGGINNGTYGINSATVQEAAAGVFMAQAADTITDLIYNQSTMGTVHANGFKIGLQGVTTGGLPDGTYLASGNGFAEFQPSSGNNGLAVAVSLGVNTVTLTAGQLIAVVIGIGSGFVALDSLTVSYGGPVSGTRGGFPVPLTNNAGTWTKSSSFDEPLFGMRSASTCYGWPYSAQIASTYSSTTEKGMLFNIPTNICSTYKVRGIRYLGDAQGSSTSAYRIANIYSGVLSANPTILQSTNNVIYNYFALAGSNGRIITLMFNGLSTLSAGTNYAVGISSSTAANEEIYSMAQIAAGDFDAWPGQQMTQLVTRTLGAFPPVSGNGNAFTATATNRPYMELLLSDMTAPAGGGGAVVIGGTRIL